MPVYQQIPNQGFPAGSKKGISSVAVKIKFGGNPRGSGGRNSGLGLLHSRLFQFAAGAFLFVVLLLVSIFAYYYHVYGNVVDQRMAAGPMFASTAKIYASAREVRTGQTYSARIVAAELRRAGYSEASDHGASQLGTFTLDTDSIAIHPGPQSYHAPESATIRFADGKVASITGDQGQALAAYDLEPQLITGLSDDKNRTKRRLVKFDEIPPQLVQAVVAIEDRRFFDHGGVDYFRIAGAVAHDIRLGRIREGGSTLTMQLARGFFLTPEKRIKRKLIEIAITFNLEHRFTKQQIFEMYANQINLGQRGSFAINGFGEAAQAYFGKDIRQLDLAECALLAGTIQSPNRLNPFRHPERATERRNLVLDGMVETGAVTKVQAEHAKAEPIRLAPSSVDAGEAPYFVDLVRDGLTQKFGDRDINREGLRIYTSLDPDLQRIATEAVEVGMENVDQQVRARYSRKVKGPGGKTTVETTSTNIQYPQVALVALNPHTGQVLALVGGRNYGQSQLNHAVAKRPTGSIFKPFVYAAAFNTSLTGAELNGQSGVFTPVSVLTDEATTFTFGGDQTYSPKNYKDEYHGEVTALYALAHSLNNATISLGQAVGFENVASLARESGIKAARGTPSVALGTYSATPLDMAGAYTVFANNGVHISPWTLASIRTSSGDPLNDFTPDTKPVLDPRVAYLTTYLMEGVMNNGYGYEVRKRGFMAPAAGKTGTSNDAWFAGYTSNLICVIWVGNDDYTDVKLPGALAAAPIWAEFMKRATKLPQYSDTEPFAVPAGIVQVSIDRNTNLLADDACPSSFTGAFLEGTQPTTTCDHAGEDQRNIFQKIFGLGSDKPPALPTVNGQPQVLPPSESAAQPSGDPNANDADGQSTQPKKKKGFFSKLFGKGGTDDKPQQTPQPAPQPAPQPQ